MAKVRQSPSAASTYVLWKWVPLCQMCTLGRGFTLLPPFSGAQEPPRPKRGSGEILENLRGAGLTDSPVVVPVPVSLNDPRCKIHQLNDQLGNNVGLFSTAANDVE